MCYSQPVKTHQFQSINEEQWKSGLSRHKCALCSFDYGDPVHCESSWPLVIVIEDCLVPELAPEALESVKSKSFDTNYAMIHALAVYAELGLRRERLN